MRRSQQQQQPVASAAAAPIIDNTQLPKPILLKCEEEGSIEVKISGFPRPAVRWQIGRKRIKESSKYQLKTDPNGLFHSLVIARVTNDLDQGVWVIATNQHGEDCCLLDVKTYNMLSGQRLNNTDSMADNNDLSGDDPKKVRKKKRRGSSHDTQSIVSLDTYKAEMDHRKRMRSADTLNNSIDAQSAYSEQMVSPKPMENGGAGSRPSGSKRVSRRDQMPSDLQHKRYSSTEAVHNELRSNSIPPLSIDEQTFASASSIPGTPYEERQMPDLAGNVDQAAQKPAKVKKSRRTRSASLTNQSQDDDDNPPRRKKVPRVPKANVSSTAANNTPEDPEKLKPPLPPTAAKKLTPPEDQSEVVEVKPRKKKAKKRTTSKSSVNDTLDKSLEDWDKPSPNATIEYQGEASEALKASDETTEDTPTSSQIEQLSKAAKKPKKRTTSKSSTASGNTLDRSLEDWNRPNQSPDVTVDQATEKQRPSDETTEPVKLVLISGTDNNKEDSMTHITDDNKADILTDDNNNDLWDLFGMKLNTLCHHLLNGKHGISTDQKKMKNLSNKQMKVSPEFIDNEAVVLVESKVEKSSAVTNGVSKDLKLNGLILTSDDSNDKLPGVTPHDLTTEIKPPTGKKKKKHPKALPTESAAKMEDRNSEYRLAMNRPHESAVDDIDFRPEILGSKTEDNAIQETLFNMGLKNQSPVILVPQNDTDSRGNSEPVINHEVQLNAGEEEGNAPTLNFEYDVDGSDQESPNSTKDTEVDLWNFDNGRLKATSWERKEFEDIMTAKAKTPFSAVPYRISLKPARSEESLAMRPRSEADAGYGRRSELLTATGRLRVARSVDRLNTDDRETSVPLIKRRSLSKEWQVVTVTTTEEIILVQKGKNDTKHEDVEPTKDLVQQGQNDTKPATDVDAENSDIKSSCPKPSEIKYIDSEDSMDMDDDFTWPSPPPMPDNEMPPLTREYAVKQINADVRLVVPLSNGTTTSSVDQERSPMKPSPPRIESTIRSRIEMLSLFGYDKKPKPAETNTSETQTSSTVEPATPEVPPPLNLDSFPESTQVHSPEMSTAYIVLQPNNTVESYPPMTASTVHPKSTPLLGEDDVFSDKGENGGRNEIKTETRSYDTRSVSQDMSTQTDQTDSSEQFKDDSPVSPKVTTPSPAIPTKVTTPSPAIPTKITTPIPAIPTKVTTPSPAIPAKVTTPSPAIPTKVTTPSPAIQTKVTTISPAIQTMVTIPKPAIQTKVTTPKPAIQTRAIIVENTDKATFELVANSCRLVTKREEKREEPEPPQNTYYVVEHNECVSPVIIHEYGEMLSFCKKQRSLSDAELNIQKTQQQKLEIQLRLQSLWSSHPQRNTEFAVQKSHESLLSDALNAHLANISAAASSRLAETRATYLLETFRTSPTRDHLTSAEAYAGSTKLGMYSRRPFSDSTL